MRTLERLRRIATLFSAAAALAAVAGCQHEQPTRPPTITIGDATDLPPVYTPHQCANVVSQFPGWAAVTPVPETDAQGRPTLFYAAITITNHDQLAALKEVGIHTDSLPIFMDPATQANYAGKVGVVSRSICGGAQIVWGLVPGAIYNVIATDSVAYNETLVEAIVLLPLPDGLTDPSITANGVHPVSYQVLHDANFRYFDDATASSQSATSQVVAFSILHTIESVGSSVVNAVTSVGKDIVTGGVDVLHDIKNGIEEGISYADCAIYGCVNLTVQLDLRNDDSRFGPIRDGQASGSDGTTELVRAWGPNAGQQLQLRGVTISAMQSVSPLGFAIPSRSSAPANANSTATVSVAKGKGTGVCVDIENDAAVVEDYLDTMEVCDFGSSLETPQGSPVTNATFQKDSTLTVSVQNKYLNVLAQLTDGRDYLQQVVGFTPDKAKVLAGGAANLISSILHGRAVTPCLNYPDVPLDALNTILDGAGAVLAGPLGFLFAGAVEAVYEDDMWLPDGTENLTSRNIPSHEYGHFAMCSLLYHEDPTKMVQIPSLIIQRSLEPESASATDEVAYLMEGWADFVGGQTSGGTNYFRLQDDVDAGNYCNGTKNDCFDWNYVEDLDDSVSAGIGGSLGFTNQVRRISTTIFDAFDGEHPAPAQVTTTPSTGGTPTFTGLGGLLNGALRPVTNAAFTLAAAIPAAWPDNADFWAQPTNAPFIAPSATHSGDAKDEAIALPGAGLRTLIHNWVNNNSALGWRVNQQQFFAALNTTIRSTPSVEHPSRNYNWCEVCQMFAQHDGLSCTVTGNAAQSGVCVAGNNALQPPMSTQQMVQVCAQSPTVPGFIGAPPAGSDPTSTCTFTGCPTHTILVGSVGDAIAKCIACGPHQVSTGAHVCADDVCAAPNVSADTCVDCADDQVVGGDDGNTCVSCPALQIPNPDRSACIPCGPHQIASGTACVDCPNDQIAMPDNTCQACPDGRMPYSNQGVVGPEPAYGESCLPTTECTCGSGACRTVNSNGICQDTIG